MTLVLGGELQEVQETKFGPTLRSNCPTAHRLAQHFLKKKSTWSSGALTRELVGRGWRRGAELVTKPNQGHS